MNLPEQFAKWNGIPREEIDWHPTIDESKCTGCGMCVVNCGKKVFDYENNRKKSIVARPLQCMVGCTSCEVWCVFDAISFPDAQRVKDIIKQKKVLSLVKQQLEQTIKGQA